MSSANLSYRWGGGAVLRSLTLLFHEQVGDEGAEWGTHGCTMNLFVILTLEEEVSIFMAELQQHDNLLDGHVGPLG